MNTQTIATLNTLQHVLASDECPSAAFLYRNMDEIKRTILSSATGKVQTIADMDDPSRVVGLAGTIRKDNTLKLLFAYVAPQNRNTVTLVQLMQIVTQACSDPYTAFVEVDCPVIDKLNSLRAFLFKKAVETLDKNMTSGEPVVTYILSIATWRKIFTP
jgi:hypothetical protein